MLRLMLSVNVFSTFYIWVCVFDNRGPKVTVVKPTDPAVYTDYPVSHLHLPSQSIHPVISNAHLTR